MPAAASACTICQGRARASPPAAPPSGRQDAQQARRSNGGRRRALERRRSRWHFSRGRLPSSNWGSILSFYQISRPDRETGEQLQIAWWGWVHILAHRHPPPAATPLLSGLPAATRTAAVTPLLSDPPPPPPALQLLVPARGGSSDSRTGTSSVLRKPF